MKPFTLVWCCVLSLTLAGQAVASRYYVNGAAGSSGTGLSWGEAKKTIAEAMDLATSGSEVWVAAGTYSAEGTNSLVVMKTEVSVYGGFAGTETELAQSDPDANPTILDGAKTSWRVVRADHITTAVLDGFIIEQGNSPYTSAATYGRGAGIYINYSSAITISNCVIRSNRGRNGGGIYSNYSYPAIVNCLIYNNQATASGGGIYLTNGAGTIASCTVAGNTAAATGGGIDIGSGASSTVITDCVISANKGVNGGGCLGGCLIANCLVSGNRGTYGGGIWGGSGQYLFLTIDSNTATQGGGYFDPGGEAMPTTPGTLTDCIFSNNQGSGIQDIAIPYLSYSLFYNNSPADYSNMYGTNVTGTANMEAYCGRTLYSRDGNPSYAAGCASGTWSGAPVFDNATSTTLLTCAAANLAVNGLAGKLINPNTAGLPQCYVMENTTTTVTVAGDATALTSSGAAWRVMNYELTIDSAAIDWGCAIGGIASDIVGTERPLDIVGLGYDGTGLGHDIGAYEYINTSSPVVWLHFAWTGAEDGTEPLPFNTLDEALAKVFPGGTIMIKPGAAAISKRITKHVRIEAPYGTARIGAN